VNNSEDSLVFLNGKENGNLIALHGYLRSLKCKVYSPLLFFVLSNVL